MSKSNTNHIILSGHSTKRGAPMTEYQKNNSGGLSKHAIIIGVAIAAVLIAFAIPNFNPGHPVAIETKIWRDMASMASAIEAYYVDHNSYPTMRPLEDYCDSPEYLDEIGVKGYYSIEGGKTGINGLTTPIDYMSSLTSDSLSHKNHQWPYAYYTDGQFWVLFSMGKDKDYDIKYDIHLTGTPEEIGKKLMLVTYDPTNGTESSGDVWRMRQ